MIHVVVRSITVGNVLHCQPCDEPNNARIIRFEHPVGLAISCLELLNERFDDDLYGIEHRSLLGKYRHGAGHEQPTSPEGLRQTGQSDRYCTAAERCAPAE